MSLGGDRCRGGNFPAAVLSFFEPIGGKGEATNSCTYTLFEETTSTVSGYRADPLVSSGYDTLVIHILWVVFCFVFRFEERAKSLLARAVLVWFGIREERVGEERRCYGSGTWCLLGWGGKVDRGVPHTTCTPCQAQADK